MESMKIMKRIKRILSVCLLTAWAGMAPTFVSAGEPLPPLPAAGNLPGTPVFHGHYQHRSRGRDIAQPAELWVNQNTNGGLTVMARLPFMDSVERVTGNASNQMVSFQVRTSPPGKPAYAMDLETGGGKILMTRRGVRQDCDRKELTVPEGAFFDPNSRPDSYCAAILILRQFAPKTPGETNELRACDWDATGDALAGYSVRMECKGREKVQVPAGTFEAGHIVLTQTSTAETWFKKRAGHVTDFWVLDNGVVVRVLRHREPYEVVLLDYDLPAKLPGLQQ
jgi:hypothetical protein